MQESPGESPGQTQSPIAGPSSLRKWAKRTGIALLFIAAFAGAYFWWNKREPQAPTEIFQGETRNSRLKQLPKLQAKLEAKLQLDEGQSRLYLIRIRISMLIKE